MPVALVPSPNPVAAGTPPQGASPLSQPVPNKGLEVAGLAELSQIVRQLEQVIPKLGVASEAGRAAAEAVLKLAKHVPAGCSASSLAMLATASSSTMLSVSSSTRDEGRNPVSCTMS